MTQVVSRVNDKKITVLLENLSKIAYIFNFEDGY